MKVSKKPFKPFRLDRNKEAAILLGRQARELERPLTDYPRLETFIWTHGYAQELIEAWREGWRQRDRELSALSRTGSD